MKKIIGGVAVIDKDGKHFLIKQSRNKPLGGKWRHPGGTFEKGENGAEGIVREIKEEIGLDIKVVDNGPFHVEKDDYKPGYFGFYKATKVNGTIKIDKKEIEDYGWFTLDEVKELDLMNATKLFYTRKYNIFCQ